MLPYKIDLDYTQHFDRKILQSKEQTGLQPIKLVPCFTQQIVLAVFYSYNLLKANYCYNHLLGANLTQISLRNICTIFSTLSFLSLYIRLCVLYKVSIGKNSAEIYQVWFVCRSDKDIFCNLRTFSTKCLRHRPIKSSCCKTLCKIKKATRA